MDEATRQQMFEPFFTTKGAGKGTGLGLSMVQGIVAQSGGTIAVESTPGAGTAMRIFLPRTPRAAHDEPEATLNRPALGGHETILVVEDQAEVRNYAAAALRAYGYTVVTAENAGEAMLISERRGEAIDLLLTDVVMPYMSGRELSERLLPTSPGLRVLYMSGHTDDVVVHHGVQDARVGFIQKPFSPQQLATAVRDALGRPPQPAA
jgi:CheY-like chemotaxis protein